MNKLSVKNAEQKKDENPKLLPFSICLVFEYHCQQNFDIILSHIADYPQIEQATP